MSRAPVKDYSTASKLRVLSVNKYHHLKGGSDRCYFDWSELLEKKGHEVALFSMLHERNRPTPYTRYFVDNIEFFNTGRRNLASTAMRVLYSRQARRRIETLIEDTRPDIAHLHNIAHQLSPSILHSLRKHQVPVVQTAHDYKFGCPTYKFFTQGQICERCKGHRYYNAVLRRCNRDSLGASLLNCVEMHFHELIGIYDNVDCFIAPSDFVRGKMIEYGVAPERVVTVRHFIRVDEYTPSYTHEDYFLFFGRLVPFKGIATLLSAMKSMRESRLYIVGEGELRSELESYVQVEGLENVRFLGYKTGEELRSLVRDSMFTIVPSEWYEVLGYTILESLALGTPVIAADIGGMPELIDPGVDGLLFEPGNAAELADQMRYLLANRGRLSDMGRQARAKIERDHNPDAYYDRVMGIYRGLL